MITATIRPSWGELFRHVPAPIPCPCGAMLDTKEKLESHYKFGHFDVTGELVGSPQEQVYANTEARGYTEGWTDEEFLARQIAKLQEELYELACDVPLPHGILAEMSFVAITARVIFGIGPDFPVWHEAVADGVLYEDTVKGELADCAVVLLNAAEALSRHTGESFDLIEAAVEKSKKDIERGVR